MAPAFSQEFIDKQKNTEFPAPEADLTGKVAIVTGSNTGLGYETVAHLMRMRTSHIIMAVRTVSKGEDAKKKLLERFSSDYQGNIDVWELDQADFASVKAFAARVEKDLDRLDIAILNAGIATYNWRVTKDGWEETLQVNDISTGLLALLLLPAMDKTAQLAGNDFQPHLDIVASEVHHWAKLSVQDESNIIQALNDKEKHDPQDRYNISKLLDVFITHEIAALAAAKKVNVTSSNPGLCESELIRDMSDEMIKMLRSISWTSEKGARTFAYAAITKDPSGSYLSECKANPISDFAKSDKGVKVQKQIWGELKSIWTDIEPKVKQVLA